MPNISKLEDPLFLQLLTASIFSISVVVILEDADSGTLIIMNISGDSDDASGLLGNTATAENRFGKNIAVIQNIDFLEPQRIAIMNIKDEYKGQPVRRDKSARD